VSVGDHGASTFGGCFIDNFVLEGIQVCDKGRITQECALEELVEALLE
jgi:hypothetical protein